MTWIYKIIPIMLLISFALVNINLRIKRLHDVGKSGSSIWGFGDLFLKSSFMTAGTKGPNKYGPDPLDKKTLNQIKI